MANLETNYTGVREYVGARYVPVFADPVEWSTDLAYEPLTIVTYAGDSYTSRQYVPKGTPIGNAEYWVPTGNFNAQLDAYGRQVKQLQTSVDGFQTEVDNLDKQVSMFSSTYDIGNYSDFKYALRAPAAFDTNQFLQICSKQWGWFKTNNWTYELNQSTTVPLLNIDTGQTLNASGAVTSCSPAVVSALCLAGYSELAGTSKYFTNTNEMRDFLVGKGWTVINDQGSIQAGDIVLQGWHTDVQADSTAMHVFVAASNVTRYDAGGTSQIQAGGPVPDNWSNLRPNINGYYENGLYAFDASRYLHAPSKTDSQPWKMLVTDTQGLTQLLFSKSQLVVRSLEGDTMEQRSVDLAWRAPYYQYLDKNSSANENGYIPLPKISKIAIPSINTSVQPYADVADGVVIQDSGVFVITAHTIYISSSSADTSQAIVTLEWEQDGTKHNLVTAKEKVNGYGSLDMTKIIAFGASPSNPVTLRLKNNSLNASDITFEGGADRTFLEVRQLA
jgi:hypothetical protein